MTEQHEQQPAAEQDAQPAAQEPAPVPTPPAQPDKPAEKSGTGDTSKLEKTLEKERELRKTAEQAAKDSKAEIEKAAQERQAVLDGIAVALGVKKDDAPADPAVLQQSLSEREARVAALQAESRAKDVELAAWRAAAKHEANAPALLDSRSFLQTVSELDPSTDGFTKSLDDAVKAALEANPALKSIGVARTPKPDPTQGAGRVAPSGAERGLAEAQRRFGQKQATTTS